MKITKSTAIQDLEKLLHKGITIEELKTKIPELKAKEAKNIKDAYINSSDEPFDISYQDEIYYQRTYINPNYGDCNFEY